MFVIYNATEKKRMIFLIHLVWFEEILQIVSVVSILFLTDFDVISMLSFKFFFCESGPDSENDVKP